jgi:uncharacterized membrane protein YfcA
MWFELALIAVGAFLAALVLGSIGFAFGIIATVIWVVVLPPATIVLLASICATLLQGASVWRFRHEIETRLLWPFVVGGVLGVPLGVVALHRIDPMLFRHLFGGFIIAYSGYMLMRPRLPVLRLAPAAAPVADGFVGWLGGILGGLAMLNGTLPAIWSGLRGWDKRRARCVYQPYILVTSILVMLALGLDFSVDRSRTVLHLLVCLPSLAAGLWLGFRIFNWVSEERFRKILLWLILASGISLQF